MVSHDTASLEERGLMALLKANSVDLMVLGFESQLSSQQLWALCFCATTAPNLVNDVRSKPWELWLKTFSGEGKNLTESWKELKMCSQLNSNHIPCSRCKLSNYISSFSTVNNKSKSISAINIQINLFLSNFQIMYQFYKMHSVDEFKQLSRICWFWSNLLF